VILWTVRTIADVSVHFLLYFLVFDSRKNSSFVQSCAAGAVAAAADQDSTMADNIVQGYHPRIRNRAMGIYSAVTADESQIC